MFRRQAALCCRRAVLPGRFSRTDGAAALLRSGSGIDRGLPSVSLTANPPSAVVRTGGELLGRHSFIEGRVPLGCYLRHPGSEIIEARQNLLPGAVGAAMPARGSAAYGCSVGMTQLTPPPDCSIGADRNLFWPKVPVLRGIPLSCQLRIHRGKVVVARNNLPSGTNRAAAAATAPGANRRLPFMAFLAPPPNTFTGSRADILRCQRRILFRVPLRRQQRVRGEEICFS